MKCPHCQTDFFETWLKTQVSYQRSKTVMKGGAGDGLPYDAYVLATTCPSCLGATFNLIVEALETTDKFHVAQILPRGGKFPPPTSEVPAAIAGDYLEANEVLPISPKASAALSRRCLQAILSAQGYGGRDLVKQVEAALGESDASKALPLSLRENIDAIRNFGNFSAHPVTDQTSLQIVDVEEGEAEWCLQILLDLFEHYYVAPSRAAAKRAALATKLAQAGKPPMKK